MSHNQQSTRHRRCKAQTAIALALLASTSHAQSSNSKRGFAFIGDTHLPDNHLLSASNSPLSWYYNWGPYPNSDLIPNRLEFTPMIHGIDSTQTPQTEQAISSLPSSSTHLLSFNEPDGTKDSGGSSISPDDAAKAYINYVVPFRNGSKGGGRKWKISHPATTGSPNGLTWLRAFNTSCYKIDSTNGCPNDFVAVHWYGAFDGLSSWLGTLNEFYNTNSSRNVPLKIWVTEMALPQQNEQATTQMMNQTLPYLDKLDYVERYAWFGAFRTNGANAWTGNGVALFDGGGGLTQLGALYMGNGFSKGQKGEGNGVRRLGVSLGLLVVMVVFTLLFGEL
jgi:hypothetical protein